MTDDEKCCCKGCKNKVEITYLGKCLCDKHWSKLSEETPCKLREILGIKEAKTD